jgi:hypothetical protein
MPRTTRARVAWLALLLLGAWLLIRPAVHVFGEHLGDVWTYQSWEPHRFTSRSMLGGSLRLHDSLRSLVGDEEVHDGAGYTHWGTGVPLLQLPFHALARHLASLPSGFFPDRAILFIYLALAVPLLWRTFDRTLAMRAPRLSPLRRMALSWAATALVLNLALYPLLASRMQVYDETMVYFAMTELAALAAYVQLARSLGPGAVAALGALAGLGLLVRPTGAIYLCVWAALVVLERRRLARPGRAMLVFAASFAPFLAFWLACNAARTGSPFSMGFQNSLPGGEHVAVMRFGSLCTDTPGHTLDVAVSLFRALFLAVSQDPDGWMKVCGLSFELREHLDHTSTEPLLGVGVLVFLVATLVHALTRRQGRWAMVVPHLAVVCLVGLYTRAGAGLAWRYIGDFWPLVVLSGVQAVRTLPAFAAPALGWPLAIVLGVGALGAFHRDVETGKNLVENLDPAKIASLGADFATTRGGQDEELPSKVFCGDVPPWPRFNVDWRSSVEGWHPDCTVDTASEVFIGVPRKADDAFVIRFDTYELEAKAPRVMVNGRSYVARREGDTYAADVRIEQAKLSSRVVLATIEWEHGIEPVEGRLLSVELE